MTERFNKVQTETRKYIKANNISAAIERLEQFVTAENIRDPFLSDTLITLSQQNREMKWQDIAGSITYQESQVEKTNIAKRLLSLMNEIPHLLAASSESDEKKELPQITYLAKSQNDNIVEVRGKLINVDGIISTLLDQVVSKEKRLNELESKNTNVVDTLVAEITQLKQQVEEEKNRYGQLKVKYEDLRRETQQIHELNYQIASLNARLEGKERELEVLRESFLMSKQIMENQRREIERLNSTKL